MTIEENEKLKKKIQNIIFDIENRGILSKNVTYRADFEEMKDWVFLESDYLFQILAKLDELSSSIDKLTTKKR